jgi:uncharacterized membrane protein YfcA
MDILVAAILFVAGLIAGFLTGALEIGGGIVLVPVLLWYCHVTGVSSLVSTHIAIGTSLLVSACAAGARVWEYGRTGHVVWRGASYMALSGVAGVMLGSDIAAGLEGPALRKIFGLVLLLAAVRLLSRGRKQGGEREPENTLPRQLAGGFLLGLVSSVSGIGGTLFAVPFLYRYIHLPLRKALGTAGGVVTVIATAGGVAYLVRGWGSEFLPPGMPGFIDWQPAIPLILGAVPGGIIGIRAGAKANTRTVRAVYAVLLLILMLRMVFF